MTPEEFRGCPSADRPPPTAAERALAQRMLRDARVCVHVGRAMKLGRGELQALIRALEAWLGEVTDA